MKYSLILIACIIVAVQCTPTRPKKRGPKMNKKLGRQIAELCGAYEFDKLRISDETWSTVIYNEEVFGAYCDHFYANTSTSAVEPAKKKVDGARALLKACKGFAKKYSEAPESGPLEGFDDICSNATLVMAVSLGDKKSQKALVSLEGLCELQKSGNMTIKPSNYTYTFDLLKLFCDEFLDTEAEVEAEMAVKRAEKPKNGVPRLYAICRWYWKKYDDVEEADIPERVSGLKPVCDEYKTVKEALTGEEY